MGDTFSCKSPRKFSTGTTVDADERVQGPAEVHDDPPISGIVFGMGEERISLAPGDEGGHGKGPNMAPSAVSLLMYAFTSRG